MDYTVFWLTIGICLGFFVQTVTGFAGALIALPVLLFVMPLPDAIGYLSIFYMISTPFHVYKNNTPRYTPVPSGLRVKIPRRSSDELPSNPET